MCSKSLDIAAQMESSVEYFPQLSKNHLISELLGFLCCKSLHWIKDYLFTTDSSSSSKTMNSLFGSKPETYLSFDHLLLRASTGCKFCRKSRVWHVPWRCPCKDLVNSAPSWGEMDQISQNSAVCGDKFWAQFLKKLVRKLKPKADDDRTTSASCHSTEIDSRMFFSWSETITH